MRREPTGDGACTSTPGEMGQRDSASTPLPAGGVKKRAPRRDGRERRRYSTARLLLEQTNAGKCKTHPDRLTLKEAAAKAGLCGRNVIQKLSQHLARKAKESASTTPSLLTPLATPAASNFQQRETDEYEELISSGKRGRVGNSGRKKDSDEDKALKEERRQVLMGKSEAQVYREQIAEGSLKVAAAPQGIRQEVAQGFVDQNMRRLNLKSVSAAHLVRLAKERPGEAPNCQGGTFFTAEEEHCVRRHVVECRARKLKVSHAYLLQFLNSMLATEDPRRSELGVNGLTSGILAGLCRRIGLDSGTFQCLDTDRQRWVTSENFQHWYDNVEEALFAEGLLELNPEWSPNAAETVTQYLVKRPEAWFSGDETQIGFAEAVGSGKRDRGVFLKDREYDDRNEITSRNSKKVSLFYLRCGNGAQLNHAFCFSGAKNVKDVWVNTSLKSDAFGSRNTKFSCVWFANAEGCFDAQLFQRVVIECIIPCAKANGIENSLGKRGVLFFDGCQTHITDLETTTMLRDAGFFIFPRVPHSSSVSQGEDTVVFRSVKPAARVAASEMLTEKNLGRAPENVVGLDTTDFPDYIARVMASCDHNALIKRAWEKDGLIPWTRCVETEVRTKETGLARLLASGASTAPASNPAIAQASTSKGCHQRELRITVNENTPVVIPKVTETSRKLLARAMQGAQLNPPTREAFLAEAQRDEPDIPKLLDIHLKIVDQFEQLYNAVHGFVRDGAGIPRAGDVYDIKGGLTSDAAMERVRLGKENVARKQEVAQTNRETKRKKFDIEYETALEVFEDKKAELASEDDLNELTKSVLSQIHLAIFGRRALQNHSKDELVLEIAGKLFEEDIKNNLADEGMDQLPGVPVAEKANT